MHELGKLLLTYTIMFENSLNTILSVVQTSKKENVLITHNSHEIAKRDICWEFGANSIFQIVELLQPQQSLQRKLLNIYHRFMRLSTIFNNLNMLLVL